MITRTTRATVTFSHPFRFGCMDEIQPAGCYEVETEEELMEGPTFQAYRWVATLIYLPERTGLRGQFQSVKIDPQLLNKALELDRA